ncbi:30S ribosomal protein S1 [Mesosutterella sp. OilRF-GAM-744-9]|uniref:Small ribosomal subunit protein bS1 n=1 Tax=Mesosutterella porci TaxID=2915351 RepID=A0ABS9MTQ6_9BURK|nr:30S ribosomal protein S1 [Mesosutterella sp. oilRF-744-WT-GAM-9]MCG5031620.1 30S ribosomal protein S1 [Mesosutterella sp. oilRF-744-WT-GAM-9]MCI6529480.1 30S ribosomal protein S1 [Mesosutterella sp.]
MSNTETSKTESFAELFNQSLASQEMRPGEVISAEVVRVDYNFVVVNAGLKSEAYIPIDEFKDDQGNVAVKPGDFVSVAIESVENGYGDTILSRDKAKRLAAWMNLEKAQESGELVTGTITGKVKGGLTVMTNGIRAFLPGSLVDTRPVRDTTPYEGKTLEFKVIKLDRKRNNVVVSRRAVLEANMGEERNKLLATLKEGAIVKGVVKNITDYGAFVDLGGIDGLLHITDLAWRRVHHPSEVVQVGQEIETKVLKFDRERARVSLGLKQLGEDPWIGIARRYPAGTRLFGKVSNITEYGAFVEIEDGIEGLVHVSEMDWTNKNVDPRKVVTLGEEVEVMVLDIDEERRRISLGMKQCKANPWEEFAQTHKKGDRVKGQIKSITDFGVFIGLDGGIDGLVHLSDLSWKEPGEQAIRNYKKGDEVEAVVLSIDTDRERISLGIKQLSGDPFSDFAGSHEKGSVVEGTVKSVDARGAVIDLGNDTEAYLRASEISPDRVEDATTQLKVGDKVSAVIISVDRKTRNIQLSIKQKEAAEARRAMERMNSDAPSAGTTNLGALLKAKLGNH